MSTAETAYQYVVDGATVVSAVDVAGAATRFKNAPLRNTLYPLTPEPPGLSTEAVHDRLNWLQLTAMAFTAAGAEGGMVSTPVNVAVAVGDAVRVGVLMGVPIAVDVFVPVRVLVGTRLPVGLAVGPEQAGVLELKL